MCIARQESFRFQIFHAAEKDYLLDPETRPILLSAFTLITLATMKGLQHSAQTKEEISIDNKLAHLFSAHLLHSRYMGSRTTINGQEGRRYNPQCLPATTPIPDSLRPNKTSTSSNPQTSSNWKISSDSRIVSILKASVYQKAKSNALDRMSG